MGGGAGGSVEPSGVRARGSAAAGHDGQTVWKLRRGPRGGGTCSGPRLSSGRRTRRSTVNARLRRFHRLKPDWVLRRDNVEIASPLQALQVLMDALGVARQQV